MSAIDRVLQTLIRVTGVFQLVVGLAFWTGNLLQLIPLHMGMGIVFVLCLFILGARALLLGAGRGFALFTIVWAVGVLIFGMNQMQILPGAYHWVIRALHLAVGLAAMGVADSLGRRIKGRRRPSPVLGARPA